MSAAPYELYRIVTDYEALQEGFIDRVEDLNVPRGEVDAAGGFTPGHASKLLCSPPIKLLGRESLGKMLKATGMALILAIDDQRFAPIKAQLVKRRRKVSAPSMRSNVQENPVNIEELIKKERSARMREIGVKGNKSEKRKAKRQKNFRRKMIARAAARARWSKRK
jgi:hypothetical protein